MTATVAYFLGAWMFLTPALHPARDAITFEQTVSYAQPNLDPLQAIGWDESYNAPVVAVESTAPIDGASFLLVIEASTYCEVMIVRHLHRNRVSGVAKFLWPDCATVADTRLYRFSGVRQP